MNYSKKVLKYFAKPRNQGPLKDADAVATVGNPKCGDIMRIYIKVGKNKGGEEIIENIGFETLGCGAAIATSSMATEMAKGKTLKEALAITNQMVADELGGLPAPKFHCSNLAATALQKAIKKYQSCKA
ncbi:MAG: NifU protein (NifU-1) [Candidatus Moranbacteria bacterium GW2011_GWE2_35_2-]|nr:MAG: NifU protein (NifU-1) [Candidatus Moranbacteria bacterium GW2011_GWE2_35_2-]KKQ06239.1 MAG: NifU protein (NifU-1) [Candidatus Moranbacteria bacterium GW2011_GWF1_36_4]KKQ22826.1 MAG: NifU protein (NifU-1) [Candidatus Moranbacteria bacterium GW2011_GWF2_37_11]KKQ28662.1 MAG: NifU protein (NifU-1) [Candidatus Moranbacteria bacterium GW2011_GWD1_37_17]KKQ30943.1 MAG: NifU protein (NifU-1) [Candidatus Moranbacteria bacterium GW2011_GWE1_37_24]KKQ47706.1 MAG: NifU protein (NifU-1) [Candidat